MLEDIKFPQSWDEIPIKVWKELNSVQSEYESTKTIERMAIITDTDPEWIRSLSFAQFNKFQSNLTFLNSSITNEVKTTFTLGRKEYGMIPHLDLISAGEWIDAENWKDKPIDNIHLYAALMYRPILKKDEDGYEIEPHTVNGFMSRAEKFDNELPITTIYGSVLFFSALGIVSMESITAFLELQQKGVKKKTRKTQTRPHTKKRNK
jgi:hypothetical protein